MKRPSRILLAAGVVFGGILAVAALGTWWILQSTWLREVVRHKIISEIERSTGGQVELGDFQYDWRTLTADFRNLVVHGTESRTLPPLLRVESGRITLRIVSLLTRDVHIASLTVERPEVHLLVRPDGTTNIPAPRLPGRDRNDPVRELLDLKVRHFELSKGVLAVDERRIPMDMRGEGVRLLLRYERARPRYEIELSSDQLHLDAGRLEPLALMVNARAALERNRLTIQQVTLASGDSSVRASGTVRNFVAPQVDLQVDGVLAAIELKRVAGFEALSGGRLSFHGMSRYGQAGGMTFNGHAEARQVAYQVAGQQLRDVNVDSDVLASMQDVTLTHLAASYGNAKLTGEANIKQYRELRFDGTISRLPLREVARYFTQQPLAWNGVAQGRVHATGALGRKADDFELQTRVQITPTSEGIPVSGDVQLAYHQRGRRIEFGDSHVQLPNSQVAFSGAPLAEIRLRVDSTDLRDLNPILTMLPRRVPADLLPALSAGGTAHFDGVVRSGAQMDGEASLTHFGFRGEQWNELHSKFKADADELDAASFDLRKQAMRVTGKGSFAWNDGAIRLDMRFQGVDLAADKKLFPATLPAASGIASGSLQLSGLPNRPSGNAHVVIEKGEAYDEYFDRAQFDAALESEKWRIANGRLDKGAAVVHFSGDYQPAGQLHFKVDSNVFALSVLDQVRRYEPGLDAQMQIHLDASARIAADHVEPNGADGRMEFRDIKRNNVRYGNLILSATTGNDVLHAVLTGELDKVPLHGTADAHLIEGIPVKGEVRFDRLSMATLHALAGTPLNAAVDGSLEGGVRFEGPLRQPDRLRATIEIDQLQIASRAQIETSAKAGAPDLALKNSGPIVIDAAGGIARVRSFKLEGNETSVAIAGTVPYRGKNAGEATDLKVAGSVNLRIFHMFDPNVESSGTSAISASIGGTLLNLTVDGTLAIKDGSFFVGSFSNGLTAVNGTVVFNRNRATLQKMTAKSGGGDMSLGGFVSFGGNGPLVYHLEGQAQEVRVRYAGSISVTANSALHLSGTSNSSILSGTLTISRVVFNANTDVGPLLASFSNATATPPSDSSFLNGLHLDITVESAPNMQFSTALSRDVEAEINLQLRGTPDHPILLGSLAANQGDIRVFGTRYSINRGEVSFFNSVKIEPVLDLDLETQTRGITVDITIAGTLTKLNITYRSDPPLQPKDIIALLTVGRAPDAAGNTNRSPASNDTNTLQSGANSVLGAAVSPVSNRLSRLFGITNIKIDPLVQGITNTPQARLTLEQQISRDISITYITNLSQTSEQVFRLEWSLNRQFSVVALRDDNGEFGIDFLYKKRFK
jgi:translocation and assembly module TamB